MGNPVAIAHPEGGDVIQIGLGAERGAELQEALAGQAGAV